MLFGRECPLQRKTIKTGKAWNIYAVPHQAPIFKPSNAQIFNLLNAFAFTLLTYHVKHFLIAVNGYVLE